METENAQEQANPNTNLNQTPSALNPISNQRRNLLLIIWVVLIIFIVGIVAYILSTRQNKTSNVSNNTQLPNQQIAPSISPTQTSLNPTTNVFKIVEKTIYIKDGDVYIYDLKTKQTKRLTNYGFNSWAVVSPDNSKVAYLSIPEIVVKSGKVQKGEGSGIFDHPISYGEYLDVRNVWVINTDGTNPIQITSAIKKRGTITWSADSSKIAYEEAGTVVEYSLNNKSKTIVGSGTNPVYSPSNSYLAYLTNDSRAIVLKLPTGDKTVNRANRVNGLNWSQSEDKIFYTSLNQKDQQGTSSLGVKFSIWAYVITEGKEKQITDESLNISGPTISPDGIYIIAQQGSGYADAGNIDLSSLVLKVNNDLSLAQQIELENFKGPSFFEKEKQYMFPADEPVWLNNKEFVISLSELLDPQPNPRGLYKLNAETLTAERLLELQ